MVTKWSATQGWKSQQKGCTQVKSDSLFLILRVFFLIRYIDFLIFLGFPKKSAPWILGMSEKPLGIGSLADSSSDFWSDGSNMIQCCWCCPSSLAKLVKTTPKTRVFGRYPNDISIPGWWYTYPSEKYESQLGCLFPIYGKMKKCSKPPTS